MASGVPCADSRQFVYSKHFRNLMAFILAPLAVAQVQLQFAFPGFASPNTAYVYTQIVLLPNSDTLFIGSGSVSSANGLYISPIQHAQIAFAALGPAMFQNGEPPDALPALGGSGNDVPQAATVDPSSNIWIAGNTDSDDFSLINPIVSQKVPYRTVGFILELDPTGTKLLSASYLAGQQRSDPRCLPCYYATSITAMAIDGTGNIYLGGSTDEVDFPTTPGAFMTKAGSPAGSDDFGDRFFYSFVVKISSAGKLVYSTLLGTGSGTCGGGSACIGKESTSATIGSMAVDSTGAVTVAGTKSGGSILGSGYVSHLSADGSRLLWSASVGANYAGIPALFMAQDSHGNLDLFGRYVTAILTPGLPPQAGTPGLFAEKLSSDGSTVIYSTDLGQAADANPAGITLDGSGNAYLAGTSSSARFPGLAGVPNLGADFVLALDPLGSKPQTLFRFPRGTVSAPPSFNTSGQLLLPGPTGSLLTLSPSYAFNTPVIVGFANAASYAMNTGLTPGELVSLFGFDLDGSPQNVQVLIGGAPATVLYAGPDQINVQVPFAIPGFGLPQIQVILPLGSISIGPVPLVQSVGLFTSDGIHAAALNQDGTVNSASNPAARGSIVVLFGTGAIWPSGIPDGTIATSPVLLNQEQNRFEIVDDTGTPASILYAGTAPGLIYGVFQMNVQLPPEARPMLTLRTYPAPYGTLLSSNAVQIYLD